ncbi:pentapeptide repeat-containing protein [Streptomyces sp. NRRL S-118]|uniref:pentapeptide repeat-containing protein n=1 Tax=Streptomyces sp. NRRL S-118 TaxID=1463881 RepID=UPI0004C8EF29|nr:pentapeptide repeat-containing protein [Streptomyces sp. NRRL S-118]
MPDTRRNPQAHRIDRPTLTALGSRDRAHDDTARVDLRDAHPSNERLFGVRLRDPFPSGVNLSNADLLGAELFRADLRHADLRGATGR